MGQGNYGNQQGNYNYQHSNYNYQYNVDVVLCIDKTGSMRDLLDTVKKRALSFYNDLTTIMNKKNKHVSQLRLKLIAFGDFLADYQEGVVPILSSGGFYNIPAELEDFKELVMGIEAVSGGDEPEDGLEALWYAINSDWTRGGNKRRHIIALWTDAPTHELGHGRASPNYPKNMVKNFSQLTALWESGEKMENNAKRLLLYAPDGGWWTEITKTWQQVLHYNSKAGNGLRETEYEELLNTIANTV